jgi:hypothetical protein
MIRKWISFIAAFLGTFALFFFTSDGKQIWEYIFLSLGSAITSALMEDSKFISRVIERAVRPFSQKH